MTTIRNLNSSSAFLAHLGKDHNMSFNHEKQMWEGNDDELLVEDHATTTSESVAALDCVKLNENARSEGTSSAVEYVNSELQARTTRQSNDAGYENLARTSTPTTPNCASNGNLLQEESIMAITTPSKSESEFKKSSNQSTPFSVESFQFNYTRGAKSIESSKTHGGNLDIFQSPLFANAKLPPTPSLRLQNLSPKSKFDSSFKSIPPKPLDGFDFTRSPIIKPSDSPQKSTSSFLSLPTSPLISKSFPQKPPSIPIPTQSPSTQEPPSTPVNIVKKSTASMPTPYTSTPFKEPNSFAFQDLDARFQSLANVVADDDSFVVDQSQSYQPDFQNQKGSLNHISAILPPTQPMDTRQADEEDILPYLVRALNLPQEWSLLNVLDLSSQGLKSVKGLENNLANLKKLVLDDNQLLFLRGVPSSLMHLSVRKNRISNLTCFSMLSNLHFLDVSHNNLTDLGSVECLSHLRELHAAYNAIIQFEPRHDSAVGSGSLECLQVLNLKGNVMKVVDFTGVGLNYLTCLDLSNNEIQEIKGLKTLSSLRELNGDYNFISHLDLVGEGGGPFVMHTLQILSLNNNRFESIDLRRMPGLLYLSADGCAIRRIVGNERSGRLEFLSIEGQVAHESSPSIDCDFSHFTGIRELKCGGNNLSNGTLDLSSLKQMTHLSLSNANVSNLCSIPPNLTQLDLSHNEFTMLPKKPCTIIIPPTPKHLIQQPLKLYKDNECNLKAYERASTRPTIQSPQPQLLHT